MNVIIDKSLVVRYVPVTALIVTKVVTVGSLRVGSESMVDWACAVD